jgi:probable DNA repair protein
MAESTSRDTPILTVSSRLARHLLFKNSEEQRKIGKQVWETPPIQDLDSWFRDKWSESWPDRYILSHTQSIKIWESIIENDPECKHTIRNESIQKEWNLLNRRSAAQKAAKAYRLIKEYKLSINTNQTQYVKETNLFAKWAKKYKRTIDDKKAIDIADLIDFVRQGMKDHHIPIPKQIELKGFEEVTPQLETWLDFLRKQNTQVFLNPDPKSETTFILSNITLGKNIQIHSLADRKEETLYCARWIRSTYKKGVNIGIIVPELDQYRQCLHKELSSNLTPSSVYPWEDTELPFDISLGTPLAKEPMIQVALNILSIPKHGISLERFLHVIKRSYLSCGKKKEKAGIELEIKLHKEQLTTIFLDKLGAHYTASSSPELAKLISNLIQLSGSKKSQFPSTWAKQFAVILDKIGWMSKYSDQKFSSKEMQCLRTWNECLDDLASLDSFIGKVDRQEVILELKQITSEKPFQVKTKEQPIQILDLKESAGITFDHLWVMGCHSDCLPAQPNPNPFLPLGLQKRKRLPHCDPKRELQFAEQTLHRLLSSSDKITFSYPLWEKENKLQASPLLSSLSVKETQFSNKETHRVKDLMQPPEQYEIWQDLHNIPPHQYEIEIFSIKGMSAGYRVIKNQADCPFQAFAAHRLRADSLEISAIDFDSRERGILIHKALELFWRKHKTRENLKFLKLKDTLKTELALCIQEAMQVNNDRLLKQPRFAKMEEERTIKILHEWMDEELLRSHFTVSHEEKGSTITIDQLKLRLRIDRIDTTPAGDIILIDYKTGEVKTSAWFTERIQDPQLPLYACKLLPQAIAFASIAKGKITLHSVFDDSSSIKSLGKKARIPKDIECTDWKILLDYWQNKLSKVGKEFMDGVFLINPLKPSETCRNCGYQTLCRIGDTELDDDYGEFEE